MMRTSFCGPTKLELWRTFLQGRETYIFQFDKEKFVLWWSRLHNVASCYANKYLNHSTRGGWWPYIPFLTSFFVQSSQETIYPDRGHPFTERLCLWPDLVIELVKRSLMILLRSFGIYRNFGSHHVSWENSEPFFQLGSVEDTHSPRRGPCGHLVPGSGRLAHYHLPRFAPWVEAGCARELLQSFVEQYRFLGGFCDRGEEVQRNK